MALVKRKQAKNLKRLENVEAENRGFQVKCLEAPKEY